MNEPNAVERTVADHTANELAKTVLSSRWSDWDDAQLGRAQDAADVLFGRYVEISNRVGELKKRALTAAEISELADITKELVELVDLNEKLREIGERIVAGDKASNLRKA
jgi:hypothetical protein